MLIDSKGYKYSYWRCRGAAVYWRCCIRNSSAPCGAVVLQHGDNFRRGRVEHLDVPVGGRNKAATIIAKVTQLSVCFTYNFMYTCRILGAFNYFPENRLTKFSAV